MSDSVFPLYPYASDPLRILAPRSSRPAGAPECSSGPAIAEEAPGDGPEPASGASADGPEGAAEEPAGSPAAPDIPPQDGEVAAAPAADGGGSPPNAALDDSPLHHPAAPDGPPPRAGEDRDDAELNRLLNKWVKDNLEVVEAMARAGEAPQRPSLPPPPPSPKPDSAERPRPYIARGDRWTKWKMAEFLRQLAATHSVTAAARAVGMSRNSAYKLRSRLKGQPFDIAWEAAFRHGYDDLAHAALELALEGEDVPHYYRGELKATHRKRNPQLMVQLLKLRNRAGAPMLGRYAAAAEFWTENWEQMTHRIETGPIIWDDEHNALSAEERAALDLPDEKKKVDQIIERNWPDEPRGKKA